MRNLSNGRVEAIFERNINCVKQMISWCRQGNAMAVVENIVVKEATQEGLQKLELRR